MSFERASFIGQTGDVEFDTAREMEGGMKRVYFTRDKSCVVAFFKDPNWAQINRDRLTRVVENFNPTKVGSIQAEYWRNLFCWPTHLVTHPQHGLGLLLPTYPKDFFFKAGKLAGKEKDGAWYNGTNPVTKRPWRHDLIDPSERGNLATYLVALSRVARAVQKMHAAGLAHSDLSERNVLIDPVTGRAIIIDVDALVVTGLYPPEVMGTPGFIAPEVMATKRLAFTDPQRKHACADTDQYALAVLIFRFLLQRHPLEGPRFIKGLSADEEEEALMGGQALYSEHRSNFSNRPKGAFLSAKDLGKTIDDLFHKTFVDGLLNPNARPTASNWADALADAFDRLLACSNPACSQRWYVLSDPNAPTCPYCHTRYRGTFSQIKLTHEDPKFTSNLGVVTLNGFQDGDGTLLYRHHAYKGAVRGPGQDNTILAKVIFINKSQPTYYLQNVNLPNMMVRDVSAVLPAYQAFPVGNKLRLNSGLQLKFGTESEALTGTIVTHDHP